MPMLFGAAPAAAIETKTKTDVRIEADVRSESESPRQRITHLLSNLALPLPPSPASGLGK